MLTTEEFTESLIDSQPAVEAVAKYAMKRKMQIYVPPFTITKTFEDRNNHIDSGDILVIEKLTENGKSWFRTRRLEVKHLSTTDFQSIDEIPYDPFMVDERYKIERYQLFTLYGYAICNKSLTAFAFLSYNTYEHWTIDRRWDSRIKALRTYYFCPKEYFTLFRLDTDVTERNPT